MLCGTTDEGGQQRDAIASVLGRTPSGLFIMAVADADGRETGMLVSWVQQASFDPPAVTVALNKKRFLNDWLAGRPDMALSLVGESQTDFLKHFSRGFEADEPAFDGIDVTRGKNGLPVLTGALGYLEGHVAGQIEAGDHLVYLVEIDGAGTGDALSQQQPIVRIRNNGFMY